MNAAGGKVPQPEQAILGRTPEIRVHRATYLGIGAAFLGAGVGVVMALQRRESACADGIFFPEGTTDFRCFEHPHALAGTAVVAMSVALACLIFLVGVLLKRDVVHESTLEGRST